MNNYNSSHHTVSQVPAAALLFSPMMASGEAYASSQKESWRSRWQSQPVNKENQEQKWRRQGKLK